MTNGVAPGRRAARRWPRYLGALVVTMLLAGIAWSTSAGSAEAADAYLRDRYGQRVRVPAAVVAKLAAKHNLHLAAERVWLPKSKLTEAVGTRKEYRIRLVKIQCETFPIVGRTCWRTNDEVVLRSIVDYRTNRQGLQQGLITAYCLERTRCPTWVNRTLASGSGFFGGGGNGGGGGGGW